jgi:hypothetical protein
MPFPRQKKAAKKRKNWQISLINSSKNYRMRLKPKV